MMNETIEAPARGRWKKNRLTRVVIMFFALIFLYAAGQIGGLLAGKYLPADYKDWGLAAATVLGVIIVMGGYAGLVHWLERRRPLEELRPGAAPGGLIFGAVIGLVIFTVLLGILYAMGIASFALSAPLMFPFAATAIAVLSGVAEELIFRGALFRTIEDGFGSLIALLFSAALFGGLHIANPHATLVSSAAIAIEAGLLLGAVYMATRTLWLPIGLHFGWNFTEGGIYSTAVSGNAAKGIIKTTLTGPDLLTGGAFGPEASIVTVGVCTVLTAVFLIVAVRRGHWKPLQFHIRAP